MKEYKLNQWILNFEREIPSVQMEFNAFFKNRDIYTYYRIERNSVAGFFSVKIIDRSDLPAEIIDRIMEVYLRSRPLY